VRKEQEKQAEDETYMVQIETQIQPMDMTLKCGRTVS
jgi:hypothetical protein